MRQEHYLLLEASGEAAGDGRARPEREQRLCWSGVEVRARWQQRRRRRRECRPAGGAEAGGGYVDVLKTDAGDGRLLAAAAGTAAWSEPGCKTDGCAGERSVCVVCAAAARSL